MSDNIDSKDRILDAAERLFLKLGFAGASIRRFNPDLNDSQIATLVWVIELQISSLWLQVVRGNAPKDHEAVVSLAGKHTKLLINNIQTLPAISS